MKKERLLLLIPSLFFLFPPSFSFRLSFSISSNRTEIPNFFFNPQRYFGRIKTNPTVREERIDKNAEIDKKEEEQLK